MIVWVAECVESQCVHGALVIRRRDQYERNRWARLHRKALGHRVVCYLIRRDDVVAG